MDPQEDPKSSTILEEMPSNETSSQGVLETPAETPHDAEMDGPSMHLDLILDIPVTVSIELGRTRLPVEQILQLVVRLEPTFESLARRAIGARRQREDRSPGSPRLFQNLIQFHRLQRQTDPSDQEERNNEYGQSASMPHRFSFF